MAHFKDTDGREWSLVLSVWLLEEIERRTKVVVDKLFDGDTVELQKLGGDRGRTLVRVLWVMIEKDAAKAGVSPESFGQAMGGDSLQEGFDALVEAFVNFSPPHQREALRALVGKSKEFETVLSREMIAKIATIEPALLISAMNSPASSGSIPDG